MAHFRGTVTGSASSAASRTGTKRTGLSVVAASWQGAIRVTLYHEEDTGQDRFVVRQEPHVNGAGIHEILAEGVVGESTPRKWGAA